MRNERSAHPSMDTLVAACRRRINLRTALIVAGLLRLASIPVLRSFLHPDIWEFGGTAGSIASGLGYSVVLSDGLRVPSVYMPPGYSYFLAAFFRLGGVNPWVFLAIEIVQAALGVLLVYLVYRLAAILTAETGAIAAACLAAIFPSQVYMCNEFHGISIYIVLGVSTVFFLVRYLQISQSWKDLIAASLCAGVMMLFRAEAPALTFLYTLIVAWTGGRKALGRAVIFLFVAFACLAPWTFRNYREFGRFIPVSASAGLNLWIGNNPLATGSQHYNFFDPMPSDVKSAFDRIPLDKNAQITQDDVLMQIAFQFIKTHPGRTATLAIRKLFLFFVYDPYHEKGRKLLYWLPSLILTLLALYGACLRGKKLLHEDLPVVLSVLFAIAVAMAVFSLPRYKIVIDPFLMVLASAVFVRNELRSRHDSGMA